MIEFITTNAALLILLAPLGVIGIWRWSVYLFKVTQAKKYRSWPTNDQFATSDVTLVIPVYNEDPEQLRDSLESWVAERPGAIVMIIDHTDESSIAIAREYAEKSNVPIKVGVTTKHGKRAALIDGIAEVCTKFVALVDSDTVFESPVLLPLLSPFVDERIGGVAPRQRVIDPQSYVQQVYRIQLEERYEVEMPFLDYGGLLTTCISGRTGMYRTEAVQHRLDELENDFFLGVRCVSGDDKCLTRMIQRAGWYVKYQDTALVWTHAADDISTFLKQRIRWTRNTWRSDLQALTAEGGWVFKNRYLAFHIVDRFLQPFTLILGPIFFITALWAGFYMAALLFVFWIIATRMLKLSSQLARFPEAWRILPHYIVLTYVIAVLKIYALFTIRRQGWITRWSKNRMQQQLSWLRTQLSVLVPGGATLASIVALALVVNLFYQQALVYAMQNDAYRTIDKERSEFLAEAVALEEEIRNPTTYRTHLVQVGETLPEVAARYNVLPAQIEYEGVFESGTVLSIPVSALRQSNEISDLQTRDRSEIRFVPFSVDEFDSRGDRVARENIVYLSGPSTALSLEELIQELQDQFGTTVVEEVGSGEWLLKASVRVGRGVVLYTTGESIEWLKLYSSDDYYTWLASFDGSMLLSNITISSWDPVSNQYDYESKDYGRSFILAKDSGRLDIINSTLSHLGHNGYGSRQRGYPFGGSYGVSWKLEAGTLEEKILTGNLINSSISRNTFGVYTYGSVGHLMTGNVVFNNEDYGFDPHDDSMYIIIEDNDVFNNGNHGIITSKRCQYNLIANNRSENNLLHGVMMDQSSNNNVIRDNYLENNEDGVVLLDSDNVYVLNNEIIDNRAAGIRVNVMSAHNVVLDNTLIDNQKGLYVYEGATHNYFSGNEIEGSQFAVHVRDAIFNTFKDNQATDNGTNIQVNEQSLRNFITFN